MLQSNATLKSLIDKLWNNFWSGGISNPLTAIEQITYLIFMKRLDDLEAKRERDAEFTGEKYTSRFSGSYTVPGSKGSRGTPIAPVQNGSYQFYDASVAP